MLDEVLVSILIVTWNSEDFVCECIKSIIQNTQGIRYEIVVIDNGSTDKTVELIKQNYPQVRLIVTGMNLGFPRAINLGCRNSQGKMLLLLNPDARVEPGAIREMTDVLSTVDRAGCVGARLLDSEHGDLDSNTKLFPSLLLTIYRQFGLGRLLSEGIFSGRDRLVTINGKRVIRRSCIGGAAMLFWRTHFEALGGLDETIPLYLEDMDICQKINDSGLSIYMAYDARILHFCGKSADMSPIRMRLFVLEKGHAPWLYFRRYKGRAYAAAFRVVILMGSALRIMMTGSALYVIPILPARLRDVLSRVDGQSRALLGWALAPDELLKSIEPHFSRPGAAGLIGGGLEQTS